MMKTCGGCGQTLDAATTFCTNCGVRVGANVIAPAQTVAQPALPQTHTRAPGGRRRMLTALGIGAAVAVIARLAFGGFGRSDASAHELIAQLPVGAAGASAAFGDGGKIDVPAGSVDKPQTINIYKRTVTQRVVVPQTNAAPLIYAPGALSVYEFGPRSIVFLRPVAIALPVPSGQRGVVFVTGKGQLRVLPGLSNGRTIRVAVTSFNFDQPGAIVVQR